ncbi:integrase core domain-containing protein [Weeksella virosa]|nr:integrase core domain-containing protein [Weeksella virosa]MDK7674901.1 integrase core domain-containing protein [Weeksella virosa]
MNMDGKGRATDNVHVEIFFQSIKYDYIYLNPAENGLDLYLGVKNYIEDYNQRRHQGIENKKPKDLYKIEKTIQLKSA